MRYFFRFAFLVSAALILLGVSAGDLRAQGWRWAHTIGGTNADNASGVAIDGVGNVYVVGTFEKSVRLGGKTLTNGDFTGLYLAKYSSSGQIQWAVAATGNGDYRDPAVAVDNAGNCYIAGSFSETGTFGSVSITADGETDAFIARCDANGVFKWAQRAGGPGIDLARGIAVDSIGHCYVTGSYRELAQFGTHSAQSEGGIDAFIAKYDSTGVTRWVVSGSGINNENGIGVTADAYGTVYATGGFAGQMTFGSIVVQNSGPVPGTDAYAVKIAPDGSVVWATNVGGANSEQGTGIAVDWAGNSYVTGTFIGTSTFGDAILTSEGGPDIFIAKFTRNGSVGWARSAGGGGPDYAFGISANKVGKLFITGRFEGEFTDALFGGVKLPEYGGGDMFVAAYDTLGGFLWARNAGSADADQGLSIASDWRGSVAVAGTYQGAQASFGGLTIAGDGAGDAFVASMGPEASVSVGAITGGPFCPGAAIAVPITVSAPFNAGNIFTAELSDASGGFASPVVLGTLNGTSGGTISGTIPAAAPAGTGYRVRVVSSNPATTAIGAGTITLAGTVAPAITGPLSFCPGDSVTLDAGDYAGYRWSNGDTTRTIVVRAAGTFSVIVTNSAGCSGTSASVTVQELPAPAKPTITQNSNQLEASAADAYQWFYEGAEIGGATSRTYTATQNGAYSVRVSNASGCTSVSDPVTVSVSGVEREDMRRGITIYPQPTSGELTVDLDISGAGEVNVVVRNISGAEVLRLQDRSQGDGYRRTIDLRGEPAGVYFIEIESGARRWIREVVKR